MELRERLSLAVKAVMSGKPRELHNRKNPRKIPRSYKDYMFNSRKNKFFGKKSGG